MKNLFISLFIFFINASIVVEGELQLPIKNIIVEVVEEKVETCQSIHGTVFKEGAPGFEHCLIQKDLRAQRRVVSNTTELNTENIF